MELHLGAMIKDIIGIMIIYVLVLIARLIKKHLKE